MSRDIEKLLNCVKSGKLNNSELEDIGNMLMKSLTPEQMQVFNKITADKKSMDNFMNSPEVKKILNNSKE